MGTIVFLLLLLSPAALGLMVARCPEGWQARGGTDQCYLVHSRGHERTFEDSRIFCQGYGGDLAYIDTAGLRDWLGQLVAATGDVGQNAYMWVGAKKVDGEWKWVETNQTLDTIILPWAGGGAESGECIALTLDSKIIKQECSQMFKFICHRNVQIPLACDYTLGWEDVFDRCYKKSSQSNSWYDSEVECAIEGGHLVTIENDAEQMLAHDLALEEKDKVWIGYSEENHPGEFTWVDGSNSNTTYWQEGQPDLSLDGFGAAVVNNDDSEGLWMVEKITNEFHYLCEKPVGSCLSGWETFETSCYYFNTESTDNVVWEDAKSICESVNAKMPVLDTDAEDTFFRGHIPDGDTAWIGLYSEPSKEIYWTDGSTMDSKNFTHMSSEDESNAINNTNKKCVYLLETEDADGVTLISSWVPTDCTSPRHYACEAEMGSEINLIPPSNDRYCPEGWEQLEDHCYYFSAEEMTWSSAEADCSKRNRDAHLASIVTWGESDFVFNKMQANGYIGLNDRNEVDVWTWTDGRSVSILNWNTGEPNGQQTENCVEVSTANGKWNNVRCSEKRAYACKMSASTSPIGTLSPTTAIPDTSACGYDWTENPETGECYLMETQELSFYDARQHCKELYYSDGQSEPDLVSIYSTQEQLFVFNLLSSEHLSSSSVWLGMKNTLSENEWTDGTPTAYYNFDDEQPSSYWTMECISMLVSNGKWDDLQCTDRHPFICEKKGKNYIGPQPPPRPIILCPDDWTYFDNHCYYFSSETTDWFTANTFCNSTLGSSLTSITNQAENDFINGVLKDMDFKGWLGLRDDDNGENWHWTDGSPYAWTNWYPGEPNNNNGLEHCGQIADYASNGEWNDAECDWGSNAVCKISTPMCPESWVYNDGKCYYVSTNQVTRNEGQVKCQQVNPMANLVNIHSAEENEFFDGQLREDEDSCWLGMQYIGSQWMWTDGTVMEYENWNSGEPVENQLCGLMVGKIEEAHGKWRSQICSKERVYGCELYPTLIVACEDGWENFEDYCYWNSYVHGEVILTYVDAQEYCKSLGANLVSIHSAKENDFVVSFTYDSYMYLNRIGLSDIGHSNLLTWADGTDVVFTYFDGFEYEDLPTSSERCVGLSIVSMGDLMWYFIDCDDERPFICKKPGEVTPLNPDTHGCQEGDGYHGMSCYSFSSTSATWNDAKSDCESRGQNLVVLGNRYETAYFSTLVGTLGHRVWLGLSGDIAADGSITFTWVTGEAPEYTYWDMYEPDTNHGTCVSASGDKDTPGLWAVRSCSDTFEYACEYERIGYTTEPPPITTAAPNFCIYGWEHNDKRCYQVVLDAAVWGDAEARCVQFGGHLASVGDEAEEQMLLALPGMEEVATLYGNVWVGLTMGSETGYQWTDGSATGYLNWADGQPDSHEGRENCGSGDASTLKLSDSVCLTHLPFICEAAAGHMQTTATEPTKPPTEMCTDLTSWYLFNDHCYKFISTVDELGQTWWEAHRKCRDEGGELASILSHEENYWIESMIYENSKLTMWIGGRAKLDTGYEWLDGQLFTYMNWASGEPNHMNDQEDCIAMYTNNYGYWNDQNCGNIAGRICKRPQGSTHAPVQTTKAPDGHCPEGWIHTGTKCVYFIMELMNFTMSRQECQKMGSKTDLASIHSAAEQAYLTAAMVTLDRHMWIGMSYSSSFLWVDQTSVTYMNWGPNEPNGGAGMECVEVSSETGLWNDISCSDTFGGICMMTQDPDLPDHHSLNNCPEPYDDYIAYDGACYRAEETPQTWKEAEATCTDEDAHLVSILTIPENSFVWAATQQNAFRTIWTGLTNKQNKEIFTWSDEWPTTYTNWGQDEPVVNLTKCVAMDVADGAWYTKTCDGMNPFICKYTNETAPTPDPPVTGSCPDSRWKDLNGGYCYLFSNDTKTWDEANRVCLQEISNLASIHSAEEMRLVHLSVKGYAEPVWIGLVQMSSGGEGWSDGTGVNYLNWQNGEPNSEEEPCTEIIPDNGKWNDAQCDVERYYLCKAKKIQDQTDKPTVQPTTDNPGGGGGGEGNTSKGLTVGGIVGIVIAVLFVFGVLGFVGYSYGRMPKGASDLEQERHSFENNTYREDPSLGSGATMKVSEIFDTDA